MADNSLVIVIRDLTTGEGIDGLTVKLRHSLNSFATDIYTATGVTGKPGCYEFTDVSSLYRLKLYVNGVEDETYGGTKGKYLYDSEEANSRHVTKVTDMSGTYYECNSLEFRSAGETTEPNSLIRKSEADLRYLMVDQNLDLSDVKIVVAPAVNNGNPVQLAQLMNEVSELNNAIAAIVVTPYQESPNVVRLIPGGVQETGKTYTSYAIIQNYCRLYPASNTHRMEIEIKGAGSGGTSITVTDGAISGNSAFNNYVSLKGINQNIRLLVDDATFSVTAGGTIIENVTIARDDDGDGTPQFSNFIFKDVYFDFDVSDLSFNGCTFRGNCYIKNTGGSISFTSCKGGFVITNGTLPSTVQGVSSVPTSDF